MKLFIIGFLVGIVFMCLIVFIALRFMYKNQRRILEQSFLDLDIVDDKVKEIIHLEENRFVDLTSLKQDFLEVFEVFKKIFLDLAKNISKEYNPSSKHPEYELTLIELLEINKTTSEYLIQNLNEKPFVILKNLRISQLIEGNVKLNLVKDFLENHKYGKLVKSSTKHLDKILAVKNIYKMVTSPGEKILTSIGIECSKYGLNYVLKGVGIKALEKAGKELNLVYSGKYYKGVKDEQR
ncbi:hypothetical protein [Candidatus Cetobacterium colombiensis]|uniref:Uncharacterized protein n=1 Tax=Candidatus Cetobacterium colombiensis TaxID=3073100 RepID=A0ABU4WC77_9FUSO|nr:hypothetical protein [Candidatus Cetobacterium colombiensis]MDX8337111.1 hypothetical protein [Candidatus Cetobacterium colombiensis]